MTSRTKTVLVFAATTVLLLIAAPAFAHVTATPLSMVALLAGLAGPGPGRGGVRPHPPDQLSVASRRLASPMLRIILAIAVTAVLAACTDEQPAPAASEGPTATAACGPVQTFPIQGEGHLVGSDDPPVPYNSKPPTSGWHSAGDVPVMVAPPDEPLREPEQVTVLELGGIVVSHGTLPDDQRSALEELIGKYSGMAALTAYEELAPGEVALTAWGALQRCDAVDRPAIESFISYYVQR